MNERENKMGVMPVGKLLISMSVPMMISMLVQALYNIVDSMFVAQLNENALTAVSLAFPVQNLMIAVGAGTGVGVNALVSRSLGEKNTELANKAANNGIWLSIFSFVGFALLSGLFGRFFFSVQTDNAQIVSYGTDYVRIVGIMSFGIFFQFIFERLLQSTGKNHLHDDHPVSGSNYQYYSGSDHDFWFVRISAYGSCGGGSCNGGWTDYCSAFGSLV